MLHHWFEETILVIRNQWDGLTIKLYEYFKANICININNNSIILFEYYLNTALVEILFGW